MYLLLHNIQRPHQRNQRVQTGPWLTKFKVKEKNKRGFHTF